MAHEKVSILGIRREEGYLYFLRGGHVMRVRQSATAAGPHLSGAAEMVRKNAFHRGADAPRYLYFLDNEGDVARCPRIEDEPLVRKMPSVEIALYAANGGPPPKETK